jgi:hypothetical protein
MLFPFEKQQHSKILPATSPHLTHSTRTQNGDLQKAFQARENIRIAHNMFMAVATYR